MTKINIESKHSVYADGDTSPSKTRVHFNITENRLINGYLSITLEGNHLLASNEEMEVLILDVIYSELFPNRAEKEAISNLKRELNKIKDDKLIEMNDKLAETKAETEKVKALVKMVTDVVNRYFITHEEELEDMEENDIRNDDVSTRSEEESNSENERNESNNG